MSLISFSEINKLICVQQSLEKCIITIVEHLKKYPNYEEISTLPLIQEQEVQNEISEIQREVKEITKKIQIKFYFLKQNKSLNNADLKQFKHEMILIHESIQNLMKNTKTKLKSLQIDYSDINQDVKYYSEKIFEWSEPINLNNPNFKFDYKPTKTKLNCVEMREFIDFVRRSGGHENGWNKDDHQLFLKYRNIYKDIKIVAKKVNEILPDKDLTEVQLHEEWYKKYLLLKMNKKEAIKRWQECKSKPKLHPMVTDGFNNLQINPHEDLKEKLLKWKLDKEIKFQINSNCEQEIQQRKRELEMSRKRKNEEVKKIVEEWKTVKLSLEQEESLRKKMHEENEKKRRSAEANKLIKQFQTQDDFYILKIKQQRKSIQNLKPPRSKSSQLALRNPDRVLKPTQQWINRVHDENIYPIEAVIPLKKLPKLGIPEWRRKI